MSVKAIRKFLPATSVEIAALAGISVRKANSYLYSLKSSGLARPSGRFLPRPGRYGRPAQIWERA